MTRNDVRYDEIKKIKIESRRGGGGRRGELMIASCRRQRSISRRPRSVCKRRAYSRDATLSLSFSRRPRTGTRAALGTLLFAKLRPIDRLPPLRIMMRIVLISFSCGSLHVIRERTSERASKRARTPGAPTDG